MSTKTGGRKAKSEKPNPRPTYGIEAELAAEKEKNGGLGKRVAELEAQVATLQAAILAIARAQPVAPYEPYIAPPMTCQRGKGICLCPACMTLGYPWTITGQTIPTPTVGPDGVVPLTVDGGVIPLTFGETHNGPHHEPTTCELSRGLRPGSRTSAGSPAARRACPTGASSERRHSPPRRPRPRPPRPRRGRPASHRAPVRVGCRSAVWRPDPPEPFCSTGSHLCDEPDTQHPWCCGDDFACGTTANGCPLGTCCPLATEPDYDASPDPGGWQYAPPAPGTTGSAPASSITPRPQ